MLGRVIHYYILLGEALIYPDLLYQVILTLMCDYIVYLASLSHINQYIYPIIHTVTRPSEAL